MSQGLLNLKANQWMRDLCDELNFTERQLIQPLFIVEGLKNSMEIPGLQGNNRMNLEAACAQIEKDLESGVRQFLLFFVPELKQSKNLQFDAAANAMQVISSQFGDAAQFWVDICLCSTLETGHCCFHKDKGIDLNTTLKSLADYAEQVVQAGATGLAPSDMMDGRIAAIKKRLKESGNEQTLLMSYSTKFASHFYGPFRGAADSAPQKGDRKAYQLDVRDRNSAIQASVRCAKEGADLLMVKPGMTSLDLIRPIAEKTGKKVGAYQVSGEYASLVSLSENGFGRLEDYLLESWTVLRRGGANFIITYAARDGANILRGR